MVWPMTGIEGLGDCAIAGQTGPNVAQKVADFNNLGMQVNPENVLGIYAAIAQEVTRLRAALRHFQSSYGDGMPLLGGDPVSPHATRAFDDSTAKLVALATGDIEDLGRVANGLADAARAYGQNEEQLKAAFDPSKFVYVPAPIQRTVADLPPTLRGLVDAPAGPRPPDNPLGNVFGRDLR
jgi:uncharacterized protein YukE